MPYLIETHPGEEWETNNVEMLYLEQWNVDKIMEWLNGSFWQTTDGTTIWEVESIDIRGEFLQPPVWKFWSFSPTNDDTAINIFTIE